RDSARQGGLPNGSRPPPFAWPAWRHRPTGYLPRRRSGVSLPESAPVHGRKNDSSGFRAPSQARGGMSYPDRRLSAANTQQRLQRLDLLFMHSRLSQWLILLASLVVAVLIWSYTSHRLVLGWLAAICGLTILSTCVARLDIHIAAHHRPHPHC